MDAIQHCQARLRKDVSELVSQEFLRDGLLDDEELNYLNFFKKLIEEKRHDCASKQRAIKEFQALVEEYKCVASREDGLGSSDSW